MMVLMQFIQVKKRITIIRIVKLKVLMTVPALKKVEEMLS